MPVQRGAAHPFARFVDPELGYGEEVIAAFLRDLAPFDTIVDLGAGYGRDLAVARRVCPDAHSVAIETSHHAAGVLRDAGHEVLELDLERDRLPFEDEAVDVVLANQVLEHVKELFWILHEASRCLRLGGHLVLGVPNLASLHNRFLLAAGRQPTQIKSLSAHVRGFTRGDLDAYLHACFEGGYRRTAFAGSQFYPFPGAMARPLSRWLPNLAFSIFLCFRKEQPYRGSFLEYPREQRLATPFYLGGEGH